MERTNKEELMEKDLEQINQLGSDITKTSKGNIYYEKKF